MEDKKNSKSTIQRKTLDILWENGNIENKEKNRLSRKSRNISAKNSLHLPNSTPASARIRSATQ